METVVKEVVDVVTACRALAIRGCGEGIGGHVSVRSEGSSSFWINAFDRTLGEIGPSDVIRLDHEGNLLEGTHPVSPGWEFHAGIYDQRSDVQAIVHSHGFWIQALASLARPLKARNNLATLFYNDQVISPDDSFASIGPAIGSASTVLIPWHGGITVGSSIGRAAALHVTLENMAKLDVMMESTGGPEIPEEQRGSLKKLVDDVADYLGLTWSLLQREVTNEYGTVNGS